MVEPCGPVQNNTGEDFHIGATRVTNDTAEMQGVVEALFWLNTGVERRLITADSLYVKGLIEEKFLARENRVLATLLRHMCKVAKEKYDSTFAGYVATQAMWRTALQIALQMLVHVRSVSIDGGDGHR